MHQGGNVEERLARMPALTKSPGGTTHCPESHRVSAAAILALALLLATPSSPARAQAYPTKPVRIISPYPPGGGNDLISRSIALKLTAQLGQQVFVENKPGANTLIGTEILAKSPPDGHTVLLTTVGHAIAPSLYKKLPFDPLTDFVNVTQTNAASMVLLVNTKVPANNLKEFVALAASKPGGLNYGTAGTSDPLGLAMEVLKHTTGMNVVGVQYKGVGPIYTALLAGEVDVAFMPTSLSTPHINSSRLRAIATASPQRIPLFPSLPTVAESGYPGFEATNWQGIFAPAKTPIETVRKIQSAVAMTMNLPEIRERFVTAGQDTIASTPEDFDAKVRSEVARYAKIVRDAKIPPLD